jgi:hypothetical protein
MLGSVLQIGPVASAIEVEITCSDPKQRRRQAETRIAEVNGLKPRLSGQLG